jgi:uncharacterized protein YecE (DUF72 family)
VFEYYCRHYGFNSVELNSTFYVIPGLKSIARLLSRAPLDFKFAVKIHSSFTHERSFDELGRFSEIARLFKEEGKLLFFLAQFPYSFKKNQENIDFLYKLHEKFLYPELLFVEIRHDSWNAFARDTADFNFTLVDLPALPHLPRFSDWVNILKTRKQNSLYFRLHGRNMNWYEAGEKGRYDYLYNNEELETFAKGINDLSPMQITVFFNNCFLGKAIRSASGFRVIIENQ